MKVFGSIRVVVPVLALSACAIPYDLSGPSPASFADRCASKAVLRCFGFEISELATHGGPIEWNSAEAPVGVFINSSPNLSDTSGRVEISYDQMASGESSLKFFVPSRSPANYAGQFYANFSDDLSAQFGEHSEFYVQWRQRFSPSFLYNRYIPDASWKQIIIGEGDRPGARAWSCTQLEIVVHNGPLNAAAMYHSCGQKDGAYEDIPALGIVDYVADQWMTFQARVYVGRWYKNNYRYRNDSLVELWIAKPGERSKKVLSHRYDLANTDVDAKYGKIWLLPYINNKDSAQEHEDAFTWYDELIISTERIPDPL